MGKATLVTCGLALLFAATTAPRFGRAAIYTWEYINPADPSQGKQPSTTLTPSGAFYNAVPNGTYNGANFTQAYLIGANLSGSSMVTVNLTVADLSNANLSNADLENTTWTGATLTGATLRSARLLYAHNLTQNQFYSTGSYQTGDLSGIRFGFNIAGWNFAGKNLTGADFRFGTNGAGANFSGANLANADFEDAQAANANFSNASLVNADLEDIVATNANFTGADIRGATISAEAASGFTSGQFYSTASYQTGDLSGIDFGFSSNLSGWNFAGKNLTNTTFTNVTLTGADFTNANIQGARLGSGIVYGGISYAQFVSTASYQMRDLQGIQLIIHPSAAGWSFVGQNLTWANLSGAGGADFRGAILTNATLGGSVAGANFSGVDIRYANIPGIEPGQFYSTANYQSRDLTNWNFAGKNVTYWQFTNQNLEGASFSNAFLTETTFVGAILRNVDFSGGKSLTIAQIYPSASYQSGDLRGIRFSGLDVSDANFAGKDLTGAGFQNGTLVNVNLQQAELVNVGFGGSVLSNVNFAQANLTGAGFPTNGAFITSANFTAADARGASNLPDSTLISHVTTNMIRPDGRILGLSLTQSKSLKVRNHATIPIRVEQQLTMDSTGVLQMVLDDDPWGSLISFAPGTPATLGGTLQLDFAPDVDVAGQIGRTIRLFDWTGVAPTGAFTVSSLYLWDTSNLYATGEVTFTGTYDTDFNHDGADDGADFLIWQRNAGGPNATRDLANWKANFAQGAGPAAHVPEPTALMLAVFLSALTAPERQRRRDN